ncbi:hypothetical protein F511_05005 [Dorcoceras hygrometricum]|uniref:Uncharacterized protein n=1 Tax=Dorcoceras hygrometricum TaxID=472368 RepID=A0A2Z7AP28_9LAMI|nr:hypothetical protein F511_05005 [Dorcoceras hygrometricum]
MLMATSTLISQNLVIPVRSSYKPKTALLYSSRNFSIRRDRTLFLGGKTLRSRQVGKNDKVQRNFSVYGAIQSGVPPPSESSFQLLSWVVGVVVTMILPFFTHKWSSLLKIRNEVETAVETIDEIVELVEKVAEGVEKVAEDISDQLPEGGKLRNAVDFVENVADTVGKDAHLVDDLIHKVKGAEEKLEESIESLIEVAQEHRKQVHKINESHEQIIDDALQQIEDTRIHTKII